MKIASSNQQPQGATNETIEQFRDQSPTYSHRRHRFSGRVPRFHRRTFIRLAVCRATVRRVTKRRKRMVATQPHDAVPHWRTIRYPRLKRPQRQGTKR